MNGNFYLGSIDELIITANTSTVAGLLNPLNSNVNLTLKAVYWEKLPNNYHIQTWLNPKLINFNLVTNFVSLSLNRNQQPKVLLIYKTNINESIDGTKYNEVKNLTLKPGEGFLIEIYNNDDKVQTSKLMFAFWEEMIE